MKKQCLLYCLIVLLATLLSSCSAAKNPAVSAVEDYLTALANKDPITMKSLSCAEWEPSAMLEYDSLQAVDVRLEGLACVLETTDGDISRVTCSGKLIATYNGENQELDLSVRTYKVIQDSGDYLICGY